MPSYYGLGFILFCFSSTSKRTCIHTGKEKGRGTISHSIYPNRIVVNQPHLYMQTGMWPYQGADPGWRGMAASTSVLFQAQVLAMCIWRTTGLEVTQVGCVARAAGLVL